MNDKTMLTFIDIFLVKNEILLGGSCNCSRTKPITTILWKTGFVVGVAGDFTGRLYLNIQ